VGASTLKDDDKQQEVDFVAPGGSLDADENGDGYPDGILAETINYQDPSSTGYWFYAGISQATAVASGAAATLVANGATRDEVYGALQIGATSIGTDFVDGNGTSPLGVIGGHTGVLLGDGGWSVTGGYSLGTAVQGSGVASFEGIVGSEGMAVASGAGSEPSTSRVPPRPAGCPRRARGGAA